MKTSKNITLFLLLIATFTVFGQATIEYKTEKPFIEVTGTAEKEITPDEIFIAITIRERHEGREKITIDKQETDLKEALKSIGVSLDNLFLSDANANYIRVKWIKKDVITKTEYVLKVEDALTVGKVFEKLDELKIMDAYISKVSHSKLEEFKEEVRIMAIKAAKEKADYLLTAIGEQTGKAMKVYEQSPTHKIDDSNLNIRGARSESSFNSEDGRSMSGFDKEKIIQFQKIKVFLLTTLISTCLVLTICQSNNPNQGQNKELKNEKIKGNFKSLIDQKISFLNLEGTSTQKFYPYRAILCDIIFLQT